MSILDKYKEKYHKFPQLQEMRKLWHSGYWDGPISGMCLIDGQKCWFDLIEEWSDNNHYPSETDGVDADWEQPWYRRYLVWKLTDEQQAEIERRHAKFQRMVGTHCDYDDSGSRGHFHYNDTVTPETFKQYYEESKLEQPMDLTPNDDQIIGWYEW
jgi:hypothetical protein